MGADVGGERFVAAPPGCPQTASRRPMWGAGSCRRMEPHPPACIRWSGSPSEQTPAGGRVVCRWEVTRQRAALGAAGGRGGHRRGATAAQQELSFPLSPEGTPLCSAVAFQLDLGLGTVKPLLSRAACSDKHGGLLLKPLPAQQACRCSKRRSARPCPRAPTT